MTCHSEDITFAPVGGLSKIRYNDLFAKYKQLIITGLLKKAPANTKWVNLMTWYNAEVFGWADSENDASIHGVEASRIEEALEEDQSAGEDQWNEVSYCGDNNVDHEDFDQDNDRDVGRNITIAVSVYLNVRSLFNVVLTKPSDGPTCTPNH